MLAVLVGCEWSYLSWAQIVSSETKRDDFMCYEWVDLHSGDYFTSVVDYLRRLLDQEGAQHLDEAGKEVVQQKFLQTVQLEENFFNHVYEEIQS
jgi:thiaminase/transcriptional activator TenA